MLLHLFVILFTGGGSASVHAGIVHPRSRHPIRSRHPPEQTPPGADTPPVADTPPPEQADGYCCGRYASYWNAFLFKMYRFQIEWNEISYIWRKILKSEEFYLAGILAK